MAYGKWKPSKSAAREFANKMQEINKFCYENGIQQSRSGDSYYFVINEQQYRVSNHSIEKSNSAAYRINEYGQNIQIREKYHDDCRDCNIIYIHAGKTRIIDIYTDLKAGHTLDGKGNRK